VLTAESDNKGEHGSGRWVFTNPETGEQKILTGKKASMLWLLLAKADYELRLDFNVLDAFTEESLDRGRCERLRRAVPVQLRARWLR
jgi:hypothetical protein